MTRKFELKIFFAIIPLVSLLLLGVNANAQTKKQITGIVRDSSGIGISGVTVREKGNNSGGVVTDGAGRYTVKANPNSTLVFSSIGYNSKQVPVGDRETIDVSLDFNTSELTQVVVTGFGTRTNTRKLAYSISEVKGAEVAAANNSNIGTALQGKVAGVTISQGTGGPSSSSRIQIRGNARLVGNTEPLIVIDGIFVEPQTTGADSWGANQDFGNIIKDLNPDDYESITVLKGSAASSLYGAKALNGVLLITTKKGRIRKGIGVNVSHTESFDKAYKMLDLQNEFGGGLSPTFAKDAEGHDVVDISASPLNSQNSNGGYSYGPKFDGHMVKDLDGRMVPWVPNNPLKDFFITGKFVNTNVAAEGGNDNGSFRVSYTNLYNTSVVPNNNMNKNVFSLRATQKITSAISLDASVNYANVRVLNPITQGGNSNPLFAFNYLAPRNAPINYWKNHYKDPLTGRAKATIATDPYYMAGGLFFDLFENNTSREENNLLANLDVNTKITPWLNFLLRANVNNYNDQTEFKKNGRGVNFNGGSYEIDQSAYRNTRVQGLLSASRNLGKDLALNVSAGAESYNNLGGSITKANTNGGLKTPSLYFIGNSSDPASVNVTANPRKRLNAVYAYGDLTWRDMVVLNASIRNDWSSTLTRADGSGKYTYAYPSVGLAWIFTELPSFKSMQNSVISFGKLRASLGYTGYDADPYITNSTGLYGQVGTFSGAGNTTQTLYSFNGNTLGNPNLKNELAREYEFGAEMRFLNDRIGFDLAYYKKNSFNQILNLAADAESGVSSLNINAGNIQNQGIELLITATPIKSRDFNWNATFNFTRNRNKIISLAPGVNSFQLELGFGADVAAYAYPGKDYGTLTTGYAFATYQAKDANGGNISNPNNGLRVIGAAPNGTTGNYFTYLRSQDYDGSRKDLGSIMPNFLAGTVQQLSYKAFSLSIQIDSKIGGLMGSATDQYGMETGNGKGTLFGRNKELGGITFTDVNGVTRDDGIIPDGVLAPGTTGTTTTGQGVDVGGMKFADAVKQGLITPIPAYAYYENLTQWSSGIREYSVFDNSWVALRQVSLGYNMPSSIYKRIHLNGLRVSVTGRNLTYLYKSAKDGVNPEGLYSNRAAAFMEYGGLPLIRSLGATINASF